MSTRPGFTLIELSIVLVIIGLIVGGVLVGRDLIHASEIRAVVRQYSEFDTAVGAFRLKFNCLPGDCLEAESFGIGNATGTYGQHGNGNGVIEVAPGEVLSFWYQLSKANLIKWAFDPTWPNANVYAESACYESTINKYSAPCLAFATSSVGGHRSGWSVFAQNINLVSFFPASRSFSGHYFWIGGKILALGPFPDNQDGATLLPLDAYAIDTKIDDGMPLSGSTLATGDITNFFFYPTVPTINPGGATIDTCSNSSISGSPYNTANSRRAAANMCGLVIKSSF